MCARVPIGGDIVLYLKVFCHSTKISSPDVFVSYSKDATHIIAAERHQFKLNPYHKIMHLSDLSL